MSPECVKIASAPRDKPLPPKAPTLRILLDNGYSQQCESGRAILAFNIEDIVIDGKPFKVRSAVVASELESQERQLLLSVTKA